MRAAAVALVLLPLVGCSNTEELLAKGDIAGACERAYEHADELPVFDAWIAANTRIDASPVPTSEIEDALGGVVRGYGTELVLYDVVGSVPGGSIGITYVPGAWRTEELVARLPELVQLSRPPRLAVIDESDLQPTPRSVSTAHRDPITDMIDAIGLAGWGIGVAIGAAVAVPVGLMVGAAQGFAALVDTLVGGGGSRESRVAPIRSQEPVDQTPADALLWPDELERATKVIDEMYARHIDAVNAERERRVALASDPNLLGADRGLCLTKGKCRALFDKLPTEMNARLRFGERCMLDVKAKVHAAPFEMKVSEPPQPPALLRVTRPIEERVPQFAREHAAALPKRALKMSKEQSVADKIEDLACRVRVKRPRWDDDGTAPDLVARIQAGSILTRAHTVFLGKNASDVSFITHGVNLERRERVKLVLVSREGRSLGGAVLDFDGRLPLVFETSAFKATCNRFELDDSAKQEALHDMLTAIATYESHGGVDSYGSLAQLAKEREAARAALVRYAAFVGFAKAPTLE